MDLSAQYQYQQQGASQSANPSLIQAYDPSTYAQYQHPHQGTSQSADPSQIQAYDQSTLAQYQHQQQGTPQAADPSQIQPYDQSTHAYYAYQYNQDYNQQYQYSYYSQDYNSNAYQQHQQYQPEPSSIHPPGVPIPPSSHPCATQKQPQHSYYPQQQQGINYGEVAIVTMPNVSNTPTKCLVTRVGIP